LNSAVDQDNKKSRLELAFRTALDSSKPLCGGTAWIRTAGTVCETSWRELSRRVSRRFDDLI